MYQIHQIECPREGELGKSVVDQTLYSLTLKGRFFIVGASLSEPHTSDTTYFRSVHLCKYIYIYVYVRHCPPKPPMHAHMLDLWF